MADVPGKFYRATKVRTGVAPSSAGSIEGEVLPPVNPPGSSLNSVGLTMPSAFIVSNSPLTSNGTIGVAGAGTVAQYIRGDGSLADFPESSGGGSSVSYYLNGSVNQGTIGGIAYKELSKVPILGTGTDFTINADGYIASFITDAGDPSLLEIPGGNWNFETYFSASSGGGSPTFYVELYKVSSGGTATLIASSSSAPELIAFGTNLNPYFSTLAVPTTTLALTDRLAVRYYVTHSGRTITLHTENNHLCQIVTTFTTGITALNGLTAQVQNFAVGTTGTDFNIASATATHTFNLPTASATNRGALSSADWSLFTQAYNDKINSASVTGTTTKTLTLTQQDGGTITASWSDLNTDAVLSVFGRTGAVVAANGDYTTAQVTESGNLYYTDARSRSALSFAAGSGAYNTSTGVITIPTNNNQITNGAGYITSAALAGYLPLSGGVMTGPITTPNNTFGIVIGDDSRLADRNIPNTLFLEGVQNNDRGYINFSQTTGNALGAINGGDLTWRGNTVLTGSASAGQVAYWSSGSAITGESNLFWDATNNRLGINNSTPEASLDLGNTGGQKFYNYNGGSGNRNGLGLDLGGNAYEYSIFFAYGTSDNGRITFGSLNGTTYSTKMTIFGNGNVLIVGNNTANSFIKSGGTSSQYLMADGSVSTLSNPVTGTGTTNYLPKFTGSTTLGNSPIYVTNGGDVYLNNAAALFFGPTSVTYLTGSTTTMTFAVNDSPRMSIFSDGNVLIQSGGTFTNNGARLQVSGNGNFFSNSSTAGNANGIRVEQAGTGDSAISFLLTGVREWLVGIDNSDSDTFKINNNTGGSDFNNVGLAITTTGAATFSSSVTAASDSSFNGVNVGRGGGSITSNTRIGTSALASNTTGGSNTAVGNGSLQTNTTGSNNTAIGLNTLLANTTGVTNAAVGVSALTANTTGNGNSAFGNSSLGTNTTGTNNSALGLNALVSNTTGGTNTSLGFSSLGNNTTGSNNAALGSYAGSFVTGGGPNNTSSNSVYLGADSRGSASGNTNEIVIGYDARGQGSNTAVIGNSSITKTILNGNVGIGTTSPSAPLHVVNSSNGFIQRFSGGTSSAISGGIFAEIGRNFASIGTTSNHAFSIFTNDFDRLFITSSGNVLIGTTTDNGHKLAINAGGTSGLRIDVNSGVNGLSMSPGAEFNIDKPGVGGGTFKINSSGRVGIGTNTPSAKLSLGSDTGRKLFVYDDGGGANDIGGGMGTDLGGFSAETSIFFGNYGGSGRLSIGAWTSSQTYSTKLTIFGNGNVAIGRTNDDGAKLSVNGLIRANDSLLGGISSSSLTTGTVYSLGGTLTNTNPSDFNLKENIEPINYGLSEILQLNAVTFNWKSDKINKTKQYGFIAQEVMEIMPELVKKGEYLGLDKEAIFTTLVKAIQELKQEIDTLKN